MTLIRQEILSQLQLAVQSDEPSKFKDLKKYIGTSLDFIGLSVPQQRLVFKKGFSFSKAPLAEQLSVWDDIWQNSGHYEMMNLAQMFASKNLASFEPDFLWKTVKQWVAQVDNWAHSDGLSSIYARLLESVPDLIYSQYQAWNNSNNPWERRQSVVGIMYYSTVRKSHQPFERTLALLLPLLKDENYFVQKGVGWTLREMGNVYPEETLGFLEENIKFIHAAAFSAAIEKFDQDTKDRLKQLRKTGRKTKTGNIPTTDPA